MAVTWNEEAAAHLLRRAGFGPRPSEIEKWTQKGLDKAVAALFKPGSSAAGFPIKGKQIDDLHADWLRRMLETKRPLREKMTLFWHGYFATAFDKVGSVKFMMRQNKKLRQGGLGSFRVLLKQVARDLAMIHWLDNQTNIAAAPNENFARELMELFSVGEVDRHGNTNYTEKDVQEAARAFTGWHEVRGKFKLVPSHHDYGVKKVLGKVGPLDGDDVVELLVDHPATARRLAARLFAWFAYPVALDDDALDPLVAAYQQNDTSIRAMVEALFRSDAFYSPAALRTRVKSPAEFLVGTLRMLKGKLSADKAINAHLAFAMRAMGQALFDPPSVAGWEEGTAWTSTNGMLARTRIAEQIADARPQLGSPFVWQPKHLLGDPATWSQLTAADVVERLLDQLGVAALPATRASLIGYLSSAQYGAPVEFTLTEQSFDAKVRGALFLVLSSPEYQLA